MLFSTTLRIKYCVNELEKAQASYHKYKTNPLCAMGSAELAYHKNVKFRPLKVKANHYKLQPTQKSKKNTPPRRLPPQQCQWSKPTSTVKSIMKYIHHIYRRCPQLSPQGSTRPTSCLHFWDPKGYLVRVLRNADSQCQPSSSVLH